MTLDTTHRGIRAAQLLRLATSLVAATVIVSVAAPVAAASSASSAYYVDCSGGSDSNAGNDPSKAWATLDRAGQATLQPGDTLSLKRDCGWTGPLHARWNGSADQPIVIGAYGAGAAPQIEAAADGLDISGSHVIVDGLSFHGSPDRLDPGCRNQPVGYRVGVQLNSGAHHNTVRNSRFSSLSMGVFVGKGSNNNSVQMNTFDGVDMMFTLTPRSVSNWDDGGAQAILLVGDYNDVGYNTVAGSIACSYDFNTDGAVVEVFGGSHNSVHDNYSENTDIFAEVSLAEAVDNIFTNNIANGHRGMTVHAETHGTQVYNSVFYSTGGSGDNGVVCAGCSPSKLTFRNNIVWAYGGLSTNGAGVDEGANVYWATNGSPYLDVQINSTSMVADPRFEQPGQDFRLRADSPALQAGITELTVAAFGRNLARPSGSGIAGGVPPGANAL